MLSFAGLQLEESSLPEKYKAFVRTTCGAGDSSDYLSGLCIGTLIPALATAYPNSSTSFLLLPQGLPDFRFQNHKGSMGVQSRCPPPACCACAARILTYVHQRGYRKKQILVSSADGQADVRLKAAHGNFSGDLKLNKLVARLHRSGLEGIEVSG